MPGWTKIPGEPLTDGQIKPVRPGFIPWRRKGEEDSQMGDKLMKCKSAYYTYCQEFGA